MEEINIINLSDIEDKLKLLEVPEAMPAHSSITGKEVMNSPFIEAAAVLIFYDPDTLQPLSKGFPDGEERKKLIRELIGCSEMVLGESTSPLVDSGQTTRQADDQRINYFLKDDIRKAMLGKLIKENRIRVALEANKTAAFNKSILLQDVFTRCLLGEMPHLEKMDLQELNAVQRIGEWFEEDGSPVPSKKMIQRHIEITEWLTPFKHLTGRYQNGEFVEQFRGRKNELSVLRKYVGMAAPQGLSESINKYYQEYIEPVFNWDKKPPLLIFGLGGVGKSTLVAKFLLDHAEAHAINRFPFVYLDFDKPSLNVLQPETMLIESSRQLAIQYVDIPEVAGLFSGFYSRWKDWEFISSDEKSTESIVINADNQSRQVRHDRDALVDEFIDNVQELSRHEKKPFLIVMDTFEEAQYKGQECVKILYDFMLRLQNKYPLLRVVVAGRAPVSQIKTQELELGDLDPEAAEGFLRKSGITDPKLSKTIVSKVGGNPLTLKLAAEIVKKYGKDELELTPLSKRRFLIFENRLPEIQIQGILYRRILKHIHDPKVLKLAHPGLVLRRITADLIFKVLAKPCELNINSLREAEYLFNEMSKEVSLVTRIDPFTLRHRPDVRKVMLSLIKEDRPAIVKEIHMGAVAYYESQEGVMARAEEFYHRLCLNESPRLLDSRWMDGIQNYLLGNMDELPPKAQAFLSGRTGVEISDSSIWEDADIEDWERRIVRTSANLLNSGLAERVLDTITTTANHVTRSGVVPLFKVRALMQLKRYSEARHIASQTLHSFYSDELNPKIKTELLRCMDELSRDDSTGADSNMRDSDDKMDNDNLETFEYSFE